MPGRAIARSAGGTRGIQKSVFHFRAKQPHPRAEVSPYSRNADVDSGGNLHLWLMKLVAWRPVR